MNRTQKIFLALQQNELEKRNLHLPKYESRKGTMRWEQAKAIEGNAKLLQEMSPNDVCHNEESESFASMASGNVAGQNKLSSCSESSGDEDPFSDGSSDNYLPSSSSSEQCIVSQKTYLTRKRKKIKGSNLVAEYEEKVDSPGEEEHESTEGDVEKTKGPLVEIENNKEVIQECIVTSSNAAASSTKEYITSNNYASNDDEVHIVNASKSTSGKRIRDKRHACYFCSRMVIHMSRHLELLHKSESEVIKIMAMAKNSEKRKVGFSELLRVGDFYHNCNVLSTHRGELILVRRPNILELKSVTFLSYGPCPYCLGYMLKKHLWHHVKYMCTKKPNDFDLESQSTGPRHVIAESNSLLSSAVNGTEDAEYMRVIVEHLRDDAIGLYCKQDRLILRFGYMIYEKYGVTQCELIRQNMRQLARLAIELNRDSTQKCMLADFLKPEKFDLVVAATKKVAKITGSEISKRSEFEIPSMALKLGHGLRKCVGIERGIALRKGDLKKNESLLSFLSLMELEWSIRISSNALATLYNRKLSTCHLLPLTSDLKSINAYIDSETSKAVSAMKLSINIGIWTRLASLVLCRIILFNKRRSGESSKITITQFLNRPSYKDSTEELRSSLSPYERQLAQQLTLVKTIGKRGRQVAVLLTPPLKSNIDLLITTRSKCGILENNPFVFARGGQSSMHMRGHDCLRKVIEELKGSLQRPDLISGTKLRKYVATVSQLFSLKENEMDWLARHLGHDISVHREFYRLHEDGVELTKISRLLLAIDEGQAQKFAGKSLDEINMEDLPEIEEENEGNDDDELTQNGKCSSEQVNEGPSSINPKATNCTSVTIENKRTSKVTHTKWKSEEKEMVLEFFKQEIRNKVLPGKAKCEELMDKCPALRYRKWTDIKFCIKNHIDKIKRNISQ